MEAWAKFIHQLSLETQATSHAPHIHAIYVENSNFLCSVAWDAFDENAELSNLLRGRLPTLPINSRDPTYGLFASHELAAFFLIGRSKAVSTFNGEKDGALSSRKKGIIFLYN